MNRSLPTLNRETATEYSAQHHVVSVVVTYLPETAVFKSLLSALLAQTNFVVIADNTPGTENRELEKIISESIQPNNCLLIRSGENLGIAAAINIGCHHAQQMGANFILLSDQDSQPADDMVEKLLLAHHSLSAGGARVGAVGPVYTDLHTDLTYPFQVEVPHKLFYDHKLPTLDEPIVEALTLITSGTLIAMEVFADVGTTREDLFIDYVDIEWCHRARSMGYQLFGVGAATMFHRMGDESLRVWYFGWRKESAYSPLRLYYRTRNYVALCKLDYIDWKWKLRSGWYSLGLIYTHVFFSDKPLEHLKMTGRSIAHGLIGKMGPTDESLP